MQFYRTDIPQTASEVFDGELVIAHYGSGLYYSISQGAALVWMGLRAGLSDEEVASWLAAHFTTEAATLPNTVRSAIDSLVAEGLLIPVESSVKAGELPVLEAAVMPAVLVERFEDLQELLLLDPVHDVTEAGWPHRPEESA